MHPESSVELDFNSLMPGAVLAQRYELLDFLGSGAYGSVYKAFDRILETLCCVKVLSPEASENEESRERFRREILLARRIAHRNCCQIFDLGFSGDLYYILMEYVDGKDVLSLLKQKQVIEVRDTLSIAYQVCSALRAAHEANVIHRDLKPQNIMVTKTGIAKIMDFGIAKGSDLSSMTRIGMAVGTPSYMSPEQCKGLDADPRSDIYSLGICLYYMMTGSQPFKADTIPALIYMHISETPLRPSALQSGIPPEVDDLVLKCLAKEPDDRYASAIELRRAISQLTQKLGPAQRSGRNLPEPRTGPPRVASLAREGSDGAERFLEQVMQSLTGPNQVAQPSGNAASKPAIPRPVTPPPLPADPDDEDVDPSDSGELEDITAMVSNSDAQATAARLSGDVSSTDKVQTLSTPSRVPSGPPTEILSPARSRQWTTPEKPRPAKPQPISPSLRPGTGRHTQVPGLGLGQPTDEFYPPHEPEPFGLGKMVYYSFLGLIGFILLTAAWFYWLDLLNLHTLKTMARMILGLARAAAGF